MEIETNDASFEKDVIEKSKTVPVLVDFWASWCGPCRMLGPILEKIAKDKEGKFVLAKLNVEDSQEKASEYAVLSIPAVKLFKNGEVADEFVGAIPETDILNFLKRNGI